MLNWTHISTDQDQLSQWLTSAAIVPGGLLIRETFFQEDDMAIRTGRTDIMNQRPALALVFVPCSPEAAKEFISKNELDVNSICRLSGCEEEEITDDLEVECLDEDKDDEDR